MVHHGIDRFRPAGAFVAIPERSRPREESLFEAAVHAFDGFLTEIPDVVGGHDGLDVSREPSATRAQIERVMGDVDFEPAVDQLAEVRPIVQVASRPIDLVDHDASPRPAGQPSHQTRKGWAATFGGRLLFFEHSAMCRLFWWAYRSIAARCSWRETRVRLGGQSIRGYRHKTISWHGVLLIVLRGIDPSIGIVEVPFQLVKAANAVDFPQAFANSSTRARRIAAGSRCRIVKHWLLLGGHA